MARHRAARRYGLRALAMVAAGAAMVFTLRGRLPDPGTVAGVLAGANAGWLVLAWSVQNFSQAAFARQQRALLAALDVDISRRDALAITYSRSAMSLVLPGGSAVSAAFALRQYRRRGASTAVAATATALSAVASVVGLALLYTATVGPPAWAHSPAWHVAPPVGMLAVLLGVLALLRRRSARPPGPPVAHRHRWRWAARLHEEAHNIAAVARAVSVGQLAVPVGYAALNWLLDLCCLIAVAHACDLPLTAFQLATVYLAVQVVRQVPLTPGGIGLIEASLLAGLVTAGAPQSGAAAAVLAYRLISCWLVLPAGLLAYVRLHRRDQRRV